MITKKNFVETLTAIRREGQLREDTDKELKKLGLAVDWNHTPYLQPLLDLLKAATPDPFDLISWWLFEDVDHIVSWEEDGKTIEVNLNDAGDLYDYIMKSNAELPENKLPLIDLPEESEKYGIPHKGIDQVDFGNYMDAVLRYIEIHDVVIDIMQADGTKCVLMSVKFYEKMFGCLTYEAQPASQENMVTVEIEIDADLKEEAEKECAKRGFTLAQTAEMFITWCAHYPEDAKKWIKWAMKEQGIEPTEKPPENSDRL